MMIRRKTIGFSSLRKPRTLGMSLLRDSLQRMQVHTVQRAEVEGDLLGFGADQADYESFDDGYDESADFDNADYSEADSYQDSVNAAIRSAEAPTPGQPVRRTPNRSGKRASNSSGVQRKPSQSGKRPNPAPVQRAPANPAPDPSPLFKRQQLTDGDTMPRDLSSIMNIHKEREAAGIVDTLPDLPSFFPNKASSTPAAKSPVRSAAPGSVARSAVTPVPATTPDAPPEFDPDQPPPIRRRAIIQDIVPPKKGLAFGLEPEDTSSSASPLGKPVVTNPGGVGSGDIQRAPANDVNVGNDDFFAALERAGQDDQGLTDDQPMAQADGGSFAPTGAETVQRTYTPDAYQDAVQAAIRRAEAPTEPDSSEDDFRDDAPPGLGVPGTTPAPSKPSGGTVQPMRRAPDTGSDSSDPVTPTESRSSAPATESRNVSNPANRVMRQAGIEADSDDYAQTESYQAALSDAIQRAEAPTPQDTDNYADPAILNTPDRPNTPNLPKASTAANTPNRVSRQVAPNAGRSGQGIESVSDKSTQTDAPQVQPTNTTPSVPNRVVRQVAPMSENSPTSDADFDSGSETPGDTQSGSYQTALANAIQRAEAPTVYNTDSDADSPDFDAPQSNADRPTAPKATPTVNTPPNRVSRHAAPDIETHSNDTPAPDADFETDSEPESYMQAESYQAAMSDAIQRAEAPTIYDTDVDMGSPAYDAPQAQSKSQSQPPSRPNNPTQGTPTSPKPSSATPAAKANNPSNRVSRHTAPDLDDDDHDDTQADSSQAATDHVIQRAAKVSGVSETSSPLTNTQNRVSRPTASDIQRESQSDVAPDDYTQTESYQAAFNDAIQRAEAPPVPDTANVVDTSDGTPAHSQSRVQRTSKRTPAGQVTTPQPGTSSTDTESHSPSPTQGLQIPPKARQSNRLQRSAALPGRSDTSRGSSPDGSPSRGIFLTGEVMNEPPSLEQDAQSDWVARQYGSNANYADYGGDSGDTVQRSVDGSYDEYDDLSMPSSVESELLSIIGLPADSAIRRGSSTTATPDLTGASAPRAANSASPTNSIQRAMPGVGAIDGGSASSASESDGTTDDQVSPEKSEQIEKVAQAVYRILRNRLKVERERLQGKRS